MIDAGKLNRRAFLFTAASAARVLGANDKIRVGLIGCGGRGQYVAKTMQAVPGVEFAALCDVYEPSTRAAQQWAGANAATFTDFRRLLDRKDIDAVQISTPDHWHSLATILACQAGKDVYVEKPLSHNIREGRAMVQAARKYNRIVQAGMQHRSAPHFAELADIVQNGKIGKVHYVRVWNYSNMLPDGIGRVPDSNPPEGLDWDMYLGPAPKRPFNEKRFKVTFRWFWDYANGTITDFGTHRFDTVHQIMNAQAPVTVAAVGGRFELKDAGEMPDMLQVTYEYPGFVLSYEGCDINEHGVGGRTPGMKYYHAMGEDDRPHGIAFYGTEGTIFADRIGFDIYPEVAQRLGPGMKSISVPPTVQRRHANTTDATALHTKKFVETLRSRKPNNADVLIGHRSTTVPLLGNIAFKTGLKLKWDSEKEDFIGAPVEASRLLFREMRAPWAEVFAKETAS